MKAYDCEVLLHEYIRGLEVETSLPIRLTKLEHQYALPYNSHRT